jgi:GntR family transcriptional repressor for pyruvate dehydrogenase complex
MSGLRRSPIHEGVIREIGALIRQRGLAPGSRLPTEEEFCRVLGIGRGRLREAIRILGALGYVDVRHGGGMYMTAMPAPILFQPVQSLVAFDISIQLELLEIRRMIEVETVARVTRTADEELSDTLRSVVDSLADGELPVEELVRLDLSFHLAIVQATGNKTLLRVFASLGTLLAASLTETLRLPGAQQRSHADHLSLFTAIMSGNEQSARAEMIRHLSVVEGRLRAEAVSAR